MITPKEINRNLLTNKSTELSPLLAAGEIDPRDVLRTISDLEQDKKLSEEQQEYLSDIKRQLVFREFARSAIEEQSYRQPPGARKTSKEFEKLKKGETGIPIIDASVKEMNETGRPHNRARLLLARYAIRNLNIDPEEVSIWLGKSFDDYDPVLTTFNVTSAASGANFGEPYFRKSNPLTAEKTLDPDKSYQKTWLPDGYKPRNEKKIYHIIEDGHGKWINRWKDAKPIQDLKTKKLYPTRDEVKGIYFIKDQIPAKGAFSPYYKNYLKEEKEMLTKEAATRLTKFVKDHGRYPKPVPASQRGSWAQRGPGLEFDDPLQTRQTFLRGNVPDTAATAPARDRLNTFVSVKGNTNYPLRFKGDTSLQPTNSRRPPHKRIPFSLAGDTDNKLTLKLLADKNKIPKNTDIRNSIADINFFPGEKSPKISVKKHPASVYRDWRNRMSEMG